MEKNKRLPYPLNSLEKQLLQFQKNLSKGRIKSLKRTRKRIKLDLQILEGCNSGWPFKYPNEWSKFSKVVPEMINGFKELLEQMDSKSPENEVNEKVETATEERKCDKIILWQEKRARSCLSRLLIALSKINIVKCTLLELQQIEKQTQRNATLLEKSWSLVSPSFRESFREIANLVRQKLALVKKRACQIETGEICPDCLIFTKSSKHSRGRGRKPFGQIDERYCPKCGRSFLANA